MKFTKDVAQKMLLKIIVMFIGMSLKILILTPQLLQRESKKLLMEVYIKMQVWEDCQHIPLTLSQRTDP
ncbi:hypothetical protein SDD27957_00670 [Streptococcus dysgalactiae subsp. dysgalactiae ATCC 27957]|nr:hypothetical protein SDD27957_00670 [Streptococcus dysgalactiae subsp. dysgalactiae ATCC 27957]